MKARSLGDAVKRRDEINRTIKRANAQLNRVIDRKPYPRDIELAPGVFNSLNGVDPAPRYIKFLREMYSMLAENLPQSPTEGGTVTGQGIVGDWTTVLTAAGFPMDPMGRPPIRYSAEEENQPTVRHKAIAEELMSLMLAKWEPKTSAKIAKKSSTGFPLFAFKEEIKKASLAHILNNLDDVLLKLENDPEEALTKYHAMYGFYISRRYQPDVHERPGVPKKREATSLLQSLGLAQGRDFADKSVRQEPSPLMVSRERTRLVYAGPAALNYPITMVMNGFRDHYLNEYEYTFKINYPEVLEERLFGKYPIGVDVKQFDQNYPIWFRKVIFNEMRQHVREDFVNMMEKLWTAPVYCPPTSIHAPEDVGMWYGDPFERPLRPIELGLPSGVSYNPDAGKWFGTFCLLAILDDVYGDVLGNVDTILKGNHPLYSVLDTSDDAVFLCSDVNVADAIRKKISSGEASPYLVFELEEPISYLGHIPKHLGSLKYEVLPNFESAVFKRHNAERSIGSNHRAYWAIGWLTKNQENSKWPVGREIIEMEKRLYKRIYDIDIDYVVRLAYSEQQFALAKRDDLTVLIEPDKIHYHPGLEPSDTVLAEHFLSISPEDQVQYVGHLIRS